MPRTPSNFDPQLLGDAWRSLYVDALQVAQGLTRAFAKMVGKPELAARVNVAFVSDLEFQAEAWSNHGQHHISISAATPAIVQGIFFEIVRFTNPFALGLESGSTHDEPGSFRVRRYLEGDSNAPTAVAAAIGRVLDEAMPEHKWQRQLAGSLAELAMVFVVAHELSHVVLGHTQLLGEHRGIGIAEARPAARRSPGRVLRAWELHADRYAFNFLWSYAFNDPPRRRRLLRTLKCTGQEPSLDLVGRLCYSVSFIFLLLSQGDARVRVSGSHPSPLQRTTLIATQAATLMEAQHPDLAAGAFDAVTRGHDLAEAAWQRLGLEVGRDNYRDTVDDLPDVMASSMRHLDRLARAFGRYEWRQPKPGA